MRDHHGCNHNLGKWLSTAAWRVLNTRFSIFLLFLVPLFVPLFALVSLQAKHLTLIPNSVQFFLFSQAAGAPYPFELFLQQFSLSFRCRPRLATPKSSHIFDHAQPNSPLCSLDSFFPDWSGYGSCPADAHKGSSLKFHTYSIRQCRIIS